MAGEKKRPKQITITYSEDLERMLDDIRTKLIEIDIKRFGKKFVEDEMNKKRGSRYSNESIAKMLIRAGYDKMKKDLDLQYVQVKKEKGELDNEIIKMMLAENMGARRFADLFDLRGLW